MSATLDLILERRQTRRRLTLWRIIAIAAIVLAAIAVIPSGSGSPIIGDHVARIRIDGVIKDNPRRDKALLALAESDRVKGVIVHINSPGGTVVGAEALYENLRRVGKERPVVAVMSEAAASGGYIAAMAAENIIARGNTLTGSIGVLSEATNVKGLLEMIGVGVTRVKSAPLKAEPSLVDVPSEAVLTAQRALIADSFAWFKNLVAERRGLGGAALEAVTDGRVFTGRQALANGLIDAIGDEETALEWLASEHGLDADISVVNYDWNESPLPWPASSFKESLAAWLSPEPLLPAGPQLYALIQ
ncbi:MAG TPA: signal peptide peptidase SppA [Thermohalobaculum sp.]|nr:signal peptide peptidase SppA [Thermohalobaculum sp.]